MCLSNFTTEKARGKGLLDPSEAYGSHFSKPVFMGILPSNTKLAKLYDHGYIESKIDVDLIH